MERHFSDEQLFSKKRRYSTSSLSDSTNSNPFIQKSFVSMRIVFSSRPTASLTEKEVSIKSSVPVLRV